MFETRPDADDLAGGPALSTLVAAAGLSAWLWATIASNHPTHSLERIRQEHDRWSIMLPNWRFFAPRPAQHDFALLYRIRTAHDEVSPWGYVLEPQERRWWQMLLSPGKRQSKSVHDAVVGLVGLFTKTSPRWVTRSVQYRMLEAFVRRHVESTSGTDTLAPRGFQFAIIKHGGYDETPEPEYLMISPYVPLQSSCG